MNKPMSWFEEKNYVTMRNRYYTRHRWPDKEKSPTDFKFGRSFIVTNNGSKVTNNGSKVKELMVPAGEAWMYDTVDGHV